MKRVKRLFACVLALTMMFGLSATAFAADKVQTPANGGTVTFEKEYNLVGQGTSPAETFNFTIAKAGVTDGGVNAASQSTPEVGEVTYTQGEAGSNTKKKAVTVTLPTYTSVGVYSYTISETAGTTAGVTYDATPVTMKVTVIDNNGALEIAAVTFTKNDKKLNNEAAFTNTYSAGQLDVSKTVTGNLGDRSKYFEFKVTLTGVTGKTYGESYAVSGGSSEANNPTSIKIDEETTFKLKHGDTIHIANLPYGVSYTVEEKDYSADKYTTTKTGDTGSINADSQTAAFTNDKSSEIDTGVYLSNLPYILIFAGVLAIAAVFVVRRRRFED